jgi:hypothetical protein
MEYPLLADSTSQLSESTRSVASCRDFVLCDLSHRQVQSAEGRLARCQSLPQRHALPHRLVRVKSLA